MQLVYLKTYDSPIFYYRLKDHAAFLELLDIDFVSVRPRDRDFLVRFVDDTARDQAVEKFQNLPSEVSLCSGN